MNIATPIWMTTAQKRQWRAMRNLWREKTYIVSDQPEHNSSLLICVLRDEGRMLMLIDPDGYVSSAASVDNIKI